MRNLWFIVVSNIVLLGVCLEKRKGQVCEPNQCCNTTVDGFLAEFCPTQDPNVFEITDYPPQIVVPRIGFPQTFNGLSGGEETESYTNMMGHASRGTTGAYLRIISMNIWGFKVWAEEKETRMPAIAAFLRQSRYDGYDSGYDVVLIQEAWYHTDFQVLKDTFKYSSFYGSPGSILCPSIRNDQSFYSQLLPIDCHGMMILSQHKILGTEHIFFKDRIPEARELFARRGAIAVTIEGRLGSKKKISLINTHLATWYSETEELWSSVREKQAEEVIALVASHKEKTDVVVVAGDLNSTPESAVYKKFINAGLTDSLVSLKGEDAEDSRYVTWGHASNTWTAGEHGDRLDYILYTSSKVQVRTSAYKTIDAKTEKDGKMISLSDHMWVQANIYIGP